MFRIQSVAWRCALRALLLCGGAATSAAAQSTEPAILVDRDMSVAAGSQLVATTAAVVAAAENAVVPTRLFQDRSAPKRTANIAYRFARLAFFDLPQESFFVVLNHEVFGHGARLRELGDGPIAYHLDAPIPYGAGGGSTSFTFDREPRAQELLAFSAAGMEASGVTASLIASNSVRRGSMDFREAIRYLASELDTFFYAQSTGDGPEEPGHDVADFLIVYNAVAQRHGADTLTAKTVRRESLAGLANPLLAVAAIGVGRFIWSGAPDVPVPALSIGSIRYVPMARYRLTPFGTEFALVNEFATAAHASTIEFRAGRSVGATPWGLSLRHDPVARAKSWTGSGAVHIWRQPEFGAGASDLEMDFGAAVFAQARREIAPGWLTQGPLSFVIEAGVKSAGFVPGQPLGSGLVLRTGLGLPLGR